MMNYLSKFSSSVVNGRFLRRGNFRISLYCTRWDSHFPDSLYNRLQTSNKQKLSVISVLDKWVLEGRPVEYEELKGIVTTFRKYRHFKPALEIAEWMSEMKPFDVTAGHAAIQLDLISKVHGVEQAENYFNGLENRLQALPVYGALLNCYAGAKSLEKAEATMEVVRKLGDRACLPYNVMLSLYSKLRKHNKMEELIQEMEEKNIVYNVITYDILLRAYGTASDIEGIEKLLKRLEVDPTVTMNFELYVAAALAYTSAGTPGKALVMLKSAEYQTKHEQRKDASRVLITLYATLKKKADVYRLWDAVESNEKLHVANCMSMISSLVKLKDLFGAKNILEEWIEKTACFNIQIPNMVISAYCRCGGVEVAETILNRIIENGKEPTASTWSSMAFAYRKNAQMENAVEMTKKSILSAFPGWNPDMTTIFACLEHLKDKGNIDEMEEILILLEKHCRFDLDRRFKERIGKYAWARHPNSPPKYAS